MSILIREFQSPDEEMKNIVLKVVKQCVATDGVEAAYVKESILPEFFRHFWVRRMALDRSQLALQSLFSCVIVLSLIYATNFNVCSEQIT